MLEYLAGQVHSIAIGGHVRPDGDCMGSCLGLGQYLREYYPQIRTDVYLEKFRDVFENLPGADSVQHTVPEGMTYDLFIVLDCSEPDRLGFSKELFESAAHTICIDHHVSNQSFAEWNHIVPDNSSTAELIYDLLPKDRISRETAECLYLGIVHDTGVFQYSCTAPETMEAAAQLMRKGIDAAEIIQQTFYEKTYVQNQLLGKALLESIRFLDGKCIASVLTLKDLAFYGADTRDLEGIVSQLSITRGVETAIFMYELEPQYYKISLRAKNKVDVSKVAEYFGGGGHKKAAGLNMRGKAHDILNNLADQIAEQLKQE